MRLAASERPDAFDGTVLESLAALTSVLGQQLPHLALREIAEAQRLGLDIEGAAALDVRTFPAGIDLIVAHVPDPAQDYALREIVRAAIIICTQLA